MIVCVDGTGSSDDAEYRRIFHRSFVNRIFNRTTQARKFYFRGPGSDPSDAAFGTFGGVHHVAPRFIFDRLLAEFNVAAFGAPITTSTTATGTISFTANPTEGDTIKLGGVVWTFVDDCPGATETGIEATLSATLTALISDLNGSANPEIGKATYPDPVGTDDLLITFDSAGTGGNAFTIAASAATASGLRLTGGGRSHVFQSGSWTLPSMSIETDMPEVPRYAMYSGCVLGPDHLGVNRRAKVTPYRRAILTPCAEEIRA